MLRLRRMQKHKLELPRKRNDPRKNMLMLKLKMKLLKERQKLRKKKRRL
jgi:hypothetical protein